MTKKFNDKILPPSVTEPLQNMINELDQLVPSDAYSDELEMQDLQDMQTDFEDIDTTSVQ